MLHLTIQSLDGIQYEGPIKQATIPTALGQITILPGHQSLISICSTGIMQIIPPEIDDTLLNKYIIHDKIIHLTISQGVLQVEDNHITILTSQATTQAQTAEILEQNRISLLAKLESIKAEQNSDNYEDILNDIQKIDADIRLSKLGR